MAEQLCVSASCTTNKQSVLCLRWCPGLSPAALFISTIANAWSARKPFQFNEPCFSESVCFTDRSASPDYTILNIATAAM